MANLDNLDDLPSRPPPPLPNNISPRPGISPRSTPPHLRRHITDPLPMRPISDIITSSPPATRRSPSKPRTVISHPSVQTPENFFQEFERIAAQLPCFHPDISKGESEELLRAPNISPGAYLLRKSVRKEGCITISILHLQNNVKQIFHINIGRCQIGYYLCHEAYFETIQELLNYYHKEFVPGDQVKDLLLLSPIYRKNINPSDISLYINSPLTKKKIGPFRSKSQSSIKDPSKLVDSPKHARHESLKYRPRPPLPIPSDVSSHHYDVPEDIDVSRLPKLLPQLKIMDETAAAATRRERAKCTCGLFVDEAELIDSWIMHLDINPGPTRGRVFFAIEGGEDAECDITSWTLPKNIVEKLKINFPQKWAIVQKYLSLSK